MGVVVAFPSKRTRWHECLLVDICNSLERGEFESFGFHCCPGQPLTGLNAVSHTLAEKIKVYLDPKYGLLQGDLRRTLIKVFQSNQFQDRSPEILDQGKDEERIILYPKPLRRVMAGVRM